MNFNYLLRALTRRIWIIILVPIVAFIAALFFTQDYKQSYESNAQLSTGFTVNDQIDQNGPKLNIPESEVRFNNVIQLITSPKVINLLSYTLVLHDLQSKTPYRNFKQSDAALKIFKSIDTSYAIKTYKLMLDSMKTLNSYNEKERRLIEFLKIYEYDYESLITNTVKVYRVPSTDFINITANSEDPDLSATVVNVLCTQFSRFNTSQQSARTVESLNALKALTDQKRATLDQKSANLRNFKSGQGVLNLDNESKSNSDLVKEFETSLQDAKNSSYQKQLELKSVDNKIKIVKQGGSVGFNENNEEIINLRDQITAASLDYERKGSSDPKLKKKLDDLREKLADLQSRAASSENTSDAKTQLSDLIDKKSELEVSIQSLDKNIADYESKLSDLKVSYGTYASKEATIASLQKEIDLATTEYSAAQEKYSQAMDLNSSSGGDRIRQTLFGQPSVEPKSSKRWLVIAVAVFSAFSICILAIVLIELSDRSIKTPYVFEEEVGLGLIGQVNKVGIKSSGDVIGIMGDLSLRQKNLLTFRENVKKIRFEIEKSQGKTFLFTSTKSSEGKTMLLTALAMVLTGARKKVILIDFNFPNNSLTELFSAKPGLESLATADFYDQATLDKHISITEVSNLHVLGCKGGLYSPSDIFPEIQLSNLLNELSKTYNYIFMEGPGLNQYSDSKELTQYADKIISVFSASSLIRQADKDSIAFLRGHEKFEGAILNNLEVYNMNL